MPQDASIHSITASDELLRIIHNFSSCLSKRKQNGLQFLSISESGRTLAKNWGKKPLREIPFVFEGPSDAQLLIIDSEGSFFKGEQGRLLVKILGAMKLSKEQVFICNTGDLKSIQQKITQISPKVIITLGKTAGQLLLDSDLPVEQFRGKFFEYSGIKVMPTFHPSRLLEQPEDKRQVWEDMKQVMAYAGLDHAS